MLLVPHRAAAQSPPVAVASEATIPGLESVAELRRRLDELKAITAPSEEDRARIDRLQQALDTLARAQANRERTTEMRDLLAQLPQRLEQAKAPAAVPAPVEVGAPFEKLEQALTVIAAESAAAAEASAREQSREQTVDADPRAVAVAARSVEIAKRLREAERQVSSLDLEMRQLDEDLRRIEASFRIDQERARVAGATGDLAMVLRGQRQALPSPRRLAAAAQRHRELRTATDLDRIEWTIMLEQLTQQERALEGDPRSTDLQKALAAQRDDYLRPLRKTLEELGTKLAAAESLQLRLAEAVAAYRDFIDERVLWARSGPALWHVGDLDLPKGFDDLRRNVLQRDAWHAVWRQLESNPIPAIAGVLCALLLLVTRPLQHRWLSRLAGAGSRDRDDTFFHTIEGLISTLLMSGAVATAMIGVGLALRPNEHGAPLVSSLGSTLLMSSPWVVLLAFVVRLSGHHGLAADHFGWRREQLAMLHRVALRTLWITTPFLLIGMTLVRLADLEAAVTSDAGASRVGGGAGLRAIASFVFLPLLAALAWAASVLFRPRHGLLAAHIAQNPSGFVARTRLLWASVIVGIPLAAIVLTLLGWWYTAAVLTSRLMWSAILAMVVLVLEAVLLRALEFGARSIAQQSRKQLESTTAPIEGAEAAQRQEARTEVAALSRKSRSTIKGLATVLLFGGLVWTWSDLLPALRVLDGITLWQGADGAVSLRLLLWALIVASLALFAARNLPGALEVLVLQHTGMSPAGRYAASAVIGYGIVIIGIVVTASILGLSWQSVQWLVAAVSVGIGFGLQEIVSNFVAGLIVLFEQPVRVGDVVTVGDRTGQIIKIRIRSTTIRDPDGKDLILPNKQLITDRVINWTLSGSPLRLVIPVGVGYGTDLALAERTLLEMARSMPSVLQTPAPTVQLTGFGASSIDFELRCFVARIDALGSTRHALAMRVQSALSEAGVPIASPQLDIHLDTAGIERAIKEVAR